MKSIRNSAKAVIIRDGCLLTLKCVDGDTVFHQLPGGGQQNGETLTDALRRECREEISAEVEAGDLLLVREYIGGRLGPDWHQVEFIFSCELASGVEFAPGSQPDPAQVAIEWLPLDELDQYSLYPKALVQLLTGDRRRDVPVYLADVRRHAPTS